MDLTRHKILRLGAGVVLLSAVSRGVSALDYPTRPVLILVGFAAGSAFDILARSFRRRSLSRGHLDRLSHAQRTSA
jgi:tripartite-type tricarboxylate transporter receptor subunit TctC